MIVAVSGPPPSRAVLVLRPSLPRYLRTMKVTVLLAAVLLTALLLRGGAFGAITSIGVIAVTSSVIPFYFRRAAITLSADEIAVTGLVRTRRTPRSAVGSVVTAGLPRSHKASKTLAHVFALDRQGRRICRMRGSRWLENDMRALIGQLGLAPHKLGRVDSARELAKSYPHAVSFLEQRPAIRGALMVLPILATIAMVTYAATD